MLREGLIPNSLVAKSLFTIYNASLSMFPQKGELFGHYELFLIIFGSAEKQEQEEKDNLHGSCVCVCACWFYSTKFYLKMMHFVLQLVCRCGSGSSHTDNFVPSFQDTSRTTILN